MFHGNKQNVQKKKKQVQSLMVKIPYMRHEEKINLISGLNMRMNNSRKQTAYRGARFWIIQRATYGARLRLLLRSRGMIDRLS